MMQKDNIDGDAGVSGGRRRFLLSAAALGSWFVAGGCASIRGERTTVPSSPPANERPTGSREGTHLITWSWHRHFDNEPNLSPMVWLSQDPKHKDVNSPLKFARRASQVAERHGRVAVHVWHPSKAWLKLAPPFGADIEGCWRKQCSAFRYVDEHRDRDRDYERETLAKLDELAGHLEGVADL